MMPILATPNVSVPEPYPDDLGSGNGPGNRISSNSIFQPPGLGRMINGWPWWTTQAGKYNLLIFYHGGKALVFPPEKVLHSPDLKKSIAPSMLQLHIKAKMGRIELLIHIGVINGLYSLLCIQSLILWLDSLENGYCIASQPYTSCMTIPSWWSIVTNKIRITLSSTFINPYAWLVYINHWWIIFFRLFWCFQPPKYYVMKAFYSWSGTSGPPPVTCNSPATGILGNSQWEIPLEEITPKRSIICSCFTMHGELIRLISHLAKIWSESQVSSERLVNQMMVPAWVEYPGNMFLKKASRSSNYTTLHIPSLRSTGCHRIHRFPPTRSEVSTWVINSSVTNLTNLWKIWMIDLIGCNNLGARLQILKLQHHLDNSRVLLRHREGFFVQHLSTLIQQRASGGDHWGTVC